MSYELRPYQHAGITDLRAALRDIGTNGQVGRIILCAATGSGKTVIAAHLIELALGKGASILFLCHRRELIFQCSGKLSENGIDHGLILAGEQRSPASRVQIASKDTLYSRAIRRKRMLLPPARLVIVDECHRSMAPTFLDIIKSYPDAVILGLTATPARKNGKALGEFWQKIVNVSSYRELVEVGALVPTRVYAPEQPDLRGMKITGGDYNERQLQERMNKAKLIGSIFHTWDALAKDRPTVIFASGVSHSLHIQKVFQEEGVRCKHIDGKTDMELRREILEELHTGAIDVLTNVGVCTEGWDEPRVSCVVLARPTKSLVLWRQMSGRAMRPFPGKDDCLVIDHAGCVFEHGFPDEDIDWDLETKGKKEREKSKAERQDRITICVECKFVYREQPKCPNCGEERPARKPRAVKIVKGRLAEVRRSQAYSSSTPEQRQAMWKWAMGVAIGRKQRIGAAAHLYRGRYGIFPWYAKPLIKDLPAGKDQWSMPAIEFYRLHVLQSQLERSVQHERTITSDC